MFSGGKSKEGPEHRKGGMEKKEGGTFEPRKEFLEFCARNRRGGRNREVTIHGGGGRKRAVLTAVREAARWEKRFDRKGFRKRGKG